MRRMLLIYNKIGKVGLGKDIFLTSYYIAKNLGYDLKILTLKNEENKDIGDEHRNIKIIKKKEIKIKEKYYLIKEINMILYLMKNAKKIDCLSMLHLGKKATIYSIIYKCFNKKGKIYVKLDMNKGSLESLSRMKKFRIRTFLIKQFFKKVDLYSIENIKLYRDFPDEFHKVKNIKNKLVYLPNGFDNELLLENNIKIKSFDEKKNMIISVGRIGSPEKNNEMLLEAIDGLNLRDYQVLFIGPFTENFKLKLENFLVRNEDKKNKVKLIGNISEKKELYKYYNEAKIFVHTSNSEGFPLVFTEALRFGNYIIITNVGGAIDITNEGKVGKIIDIGDAKKLREEINKAIDGRINLSEKYEESIKYSLEKFDIEKLVKVVKL